MAKKRKAIIDAAVAGLLLGATSCSADSDTRADATDPAREMDAGQLTPTSLKSGAGVEENCAGRCAGRCAGGCAGVDAQTKKN